MYSLHGPTRVGRGPSGPQGDERRRVVYRGDQAVVINPQGDRIAVGQGFVAATKGIEGSFGQVCIVCRNTGTQRS